MITDHDPAAGAPASQGRRVAGLLVDMVASVAVAALFTGGAPGLWSTVVFLAQGFVLLTTLRQTLGMRLLGTVLAPAGPGGPWPLRVAVRTGLLFLIIPAVLTAADGRAFHDRLAGTAIVRVRAREDLAGSG